MQGKRIIFDYETKHNFQGTGLVIVDLDINNAELD
jgi:hypothetical protein